ncbi:MAG: hypothetical protein KC476_07750 [Cyanobacteria bacterium HKST-UBA06]|nr:hypothetical protein [Cyanobacteria bacterium HKST-UBA06]
MSNRHQIRHSILLAALVGSFWMMLATPARCLASELQTIHEELAVQDAEQTQRQMTHLDLLWRHALQHNPSVILALEKLSEKAEEGSSGSRKKQFASNMVKQMVSLGGLGSSIALGSPVPMIGSSIFGNFAGLTDAQKNLNHITPTDMVLLAREISHIQSEIVEQYLAYRQSMQEVGYYEQLANQLHKKMAVAKISGLRPDGTQADPYYDQLHAWWLDSQFKQVQAQTRLKSARQVLMWTCGVDALHELDKHLATDPTMIPHTTNTDGQATRHAPVDPPTVGMVESQL